MMSEPGEDKLGQLVIGNIRGPLFTQQGMDWVNLGSTIALLVNISNCALGTGWLTRST